MPISKAPIKSCSQPIFDEYQIAFIGGGLNDTGPCRATPEILATSPSAQRVKNVQRSNGKVF